MIHNLIVLTKDNLSERPDPTWEQRDFVSQVSDFMQYRSGGITMVSGLRGTGKTVGLMQTIEYNDPLYIRCCEKGKVSINQVLDIIRSNPEKSNIIIDEFTWLKEFLPPETVDDYAKRGDAERSIVALSESGKNIILTGTESASLEAIKSRGFIHRTADTLHVTRFSFSEYTRIFKNSLPPRQQERYDAFLREAGIFDEYVKRSVNGIDEFIRDSIVENLYAYIGSDKGLTREQIASGVYTVLFEAVRDIVNTSIPKEKFIEQAKAKLAAMGVPDVTEKLRPEAVLRISETLESIGVIVKIPNAVPRQKRFDEARLDDERTYIVNPAISYRLARVVFGDIDKEKDFLGHLMEAAVLVELDAIKRPGDKVYFFENDNREIGAVIAPIRGESPVSLIEVKHRYTISYDDLTKKTWSILSDEAEKRISERFPDNDIENRYFVYTGPQQILTSPKNNNTYLLIGIDECLQRYWDFDGNMNLIQKKMRTEQKNQHDSDLSKNPARISTELV
ncbi:MAG: ATP-binding protein [Desulfovibrionaceae bacterium]|nr:ATP-binding protein [Desulfovibrionaceae bacterium]